MHKILTNPDEFCFPRYKLKDTGFIEVFLYEMRFVCRIRHILAEVEYTLPNQHPL